MKRSSFTVLWLLMQFPVCGQDTASLRRASVLLNTALVRKDAVLIKSLVRKSAKYAHSNGWTETRSDLIKNLYNGTLSYAQIQLSECNTATEGNTGIVRSKGTYDVIMENKLAHYKLKVIQIWKYKHGNWKLASRTSEQAEEVNRGK